MQNAIAALRTFALAMLLLFVSASIAVGQNLIHNGSFEEGSPIPEPPGYVRIDPVQFFGSSAPEEILHPPFAHVFPWDVLSNRFYSHAVDHHVGLSNTPHGTKAMDLHPTFMVFPPWCGDDPPPRPEGPAEGYDGQYACQPRFFANGSLVQYLIPTIPGKDYFLSFWYALPYENYYYPLPDDFLVDLSPEQFYENGNGGDVIPSLLNVDVAGFCPFGQCGYEQAEAALAAGPVELDPEDPEFPQFLDRILFRSAFNWTLPSTDFYQGSNPVEAPETLTFGTQWADRPAIPSPFEDLVWTKINLRFTANSFSSRVRFRMFYPPGEIQPPRPDPDGPAYPEVGEGTEPATGFGFPFWYRVDDDYGWFIDDVELFQHGDINEDDRLDSKFDVIGDLYDAAASCPTPVQVKLMKVVARIQASLNPIYWVNPGIYQLNPENGRSVFDNEYLAAEQLEMAEADLGNLPAEDCRDAIRRAKQRLMDADFVIVRFELDRARIACTSGPCLEDLLFAQRLLRDADQWWIGHDLKWAIDKYGDAWEAAIRALLGGFITPAGAGSLTGEGTSAVGGPPQAGPGSISTASENDVTLPETVVLEPNYPNPFNPVTTIRFGLPETTDVNLAVYDLMGREVARLASGVQSAGYHSVSFDARDLPSGLYVYRLTAGSAALSGRMMLVK